MRLPNTFPRLKGFRFPPEIVAHAVWAYHLFAKRRVVVSRETVRLRTNRFGHHFADCIRRDWPKPTDKWHLDEIVVTIGGKKFCLKPAVAPKLRSVFLQVGQAIRLAARRSDGQAEKLYQADSNQCAGC